MDAALAAKPRIRPVPPARRASASSIVSPPARADITSAQSLSPRSGVRIDELGDAEMVGQGGWREESRIGDEPVVVKGHVEPVNSVR